MSVHRDITVDRGSDWAAVIDVSQNGTPVDLSSYTATMQITGLAPSQIAGNVSVNSGRISLGLAHVVTAAMYRGVGTWELWLTSPNGSLTRLYSGSVRVS